MQQHDIQALAARVLERVERNRRCNTNATTLENQCNKTTPKRDLKVASEKEPQSEFREKSRGHKPQLIAHNRSIDIRTRGRNPRAYRVAVDGKQLVFINHTQVENVKELMERKFGAERVGSITAIGAPGSSGEAS